MKTESISFSLRVASESQSPRRTDRACSHLWSDGPPLSLGRLIAAEPWRISAKKSHPKTLGWGGRGAAVCCLPDGVDSRVAALVVFDELCSTKAKHLEQPCGLSIWPSPYLPEPDAPNNCELNSMNDSWRRDACCAQKPASSSDGECWKSYEYAQDINPAASCVWVCVICEIICVWPMRRAPSGFPDYKIRNWMLNCQNR